MTLSTPLLRCAFLLGFSAALAYSQCTFTVTPSPAYFDSTAQTTAIQVNASDPTCSWDATSVGFASISGSASGTGSGQVTYVVSQNATGADRSVTVNIAGQTLQLNQRATASTFSDVAPGDFDFDAVNLMGQKQITAGCATQPTLQYCPGQNITRGQMAVFIIRAINGGGAGGDTFSNTTTPYFTDVPSTHPFFNWIQKMKDLGITAGCGVALYCPDSPVTRDEMAAFIIRARYGAATSFAFASSPFFTDVSAGNNFFKWIQKMKQAGITGGCTTTTYCPGDPVTRGEMAIFIMRGGFNLLLPAGTPVIANVSPASGQAGSVVSVTITGQNTNFLPGTTTVTAGPLITPGGVTVASPTSLTAQFVVSSSAPVGPVSVIAITGPEEAVGPNLFTIGASAPPPGAVTIDNFSFLPPSLTIGTGAQVIWTNQQTGVTHRVAADDGSYLSQNLPSGATFSQTFTAPGTYTYHCAIHPFMTGSVTVQ
jgi:plastocyanin